MKTLLAYDTETTGLPAYKDPSDAPHQPHIVQLAAKVVDLDTRLPVSQMNVIIKPNGWIIPAEVSAIHGITTERAMDEGIDEREAVEQFLSMWRPNPETFLRRIGHNESFDARIVRIATKRYFDAVTQTMWKGGDALCTARMASPIMSMPATTAMKKSGRNFPKTPKLSEAYEYFMNKPLEGAHDAMNDVDACLAVYFAIQDIPQVEEQAA